MAAPLKVDDQTAAVTTHAAHFSAWRLLQNGGDGRFTTFAMI